MLPENSIPIIGTRAFEPKNIMSSFPELPNIEPSRAELLKTCGSRAKFRAEPRLDTPLTKSAAKIVQNSRRFYVKTRNRKNGNDTDLFFKKVDLKLPKILHYFCSTFC